MLSAVAWVPVRHPLCTACCLSRHVARPGLRAGGADARADGAGGPLAAGHEARREDGGDAAGSVRDVVSVVFGLLAFETLPAADAQRAITAIAATVLLSVVSHGAVPAPLGRYCAGTHPSVPNGAKAPGDG